MGLPTPPDSYPLVWEPGDAVELRPTHEIEARAAILNVLLGRVFGMPHEQAMQWLLSAHLLEYVTPPEWQFVIRGGGDEAAERMAYSTHLEAMFGFAWLLGLVEHLDPARHSTDGLAQLFPNLPAREPYQRWRSRTLPAARNPREVATMLDLYYCLDWVCQRAGAHGRVDPIGIGQRRWALEWALVFHGPYHDPPADWEAVDLSN